MADAPDLGSGAARRGGSSPPSRIPIKSGSYEGRLGEPIIGCSQIVAEVWLFSCSESESSPNVSGELLIPSATLVLGRSPLQIVQSTMGIRESLLYSLQGAVNPPPMAVERVAGSAPFANHRRNQLQQGIGESNYSEGCGIKTLNGIDQL
jgi:hypothetical protein